MKAHGSIPPIIKSDRPTTEDTLGFSMYRDTLVKIITSAQTPATMAIFGKWGSGKTSLMQMVEKQLDARHRKRCCTVWFNAWKYNQEDVLWRALLLHLIDKIRKFVESSKEKTKKGEVEANLTELDRFEQSLYRSVEWEEYIRWNIDWAKALSSTAELAADIALPFVPGAKPLLDFLKQIKKRGKGDENASIAEAFRKEVIKHQREQALSFEQFERNFAEIVRKFIGPHNRLVVFVDDLDRCLPNNIVKVLEAIKLFLDVEGCVFVLGFDLDAVEDAIRQRFNGDTTRGRLYLEKIIQVPFYLPPVEKGRMTDYLNGLAGELPAGCCDVFARGLGDNPREAKRVVNIFLLLWQLSQSQMELKDRINAVRLSKFVVIQHNYPEIYRALRSTPNYLKELEKFIHTDEEAIEQNIVRPSVGKVLPAFWEPYINQKDLRDILTCRLEDGFSELSLEDLSLYIYLVYRAQLSPAGYFPYEPQTVKVNGGKFTLGISASRAKEIARKFSISQEGFLSETPSHAVTLSPYEIARFPVTNREYFAFVDDSGYRAPRHWETGKYNQRLSEHPVVNVSWQDATEYCQWLSRKTGKKYHLPSEEEWEVAARGSKDICYPWGNEWEKENCNSNDNNIMDTSPVEQFSQRGDSWCGCADMAGNVLEWTNSQFIAYPDSKDIHTQFDPLLQVLRGGSWRHPPEKIRCTYRSCYAPETCENWIGFRCAREL